MSIAMTSTELEWVSTPDRVACVTPQGAVFDDTAEHWREALLRLLNLSDEQGRAWVESVAALSLAADSRPFFDRPPEDRLKVVARASQCVFRCPPGAEFPSLAATALGAPIDHVWFRGMREDPSYAVVGNRQLQHGILAHQQQGRWQLVKPMPYEEEYFEGNQLGVGYGRCREQAAWRLEKAARLVRQIRGIGQFVGRNLDSEVRLLDVGAGYGYFRKAATDSGWTTYGVEISRHAAAVAQQEFGMDTFVGTLQDYARAGAGHSYDVLTLFDVVEHVEDPVALLETVRSLLKPEGLCVLRTPNLLSIDGEVFGSYYHSLKIEHLHHFSATSLGHAMEKAGLRPAFLTTESNLLRGFLGPALSSYAACLRGSDIFAAGLAPANE
jgi:2-polyprenyl-3-methyl-5-hydroxy-6-metoxy-1,4-benzoquinol methylase